MRILIACSKNSQFKQTLITVLERTGHIVSDAMAPPIDCNCAQELVDFLRPPKDLSHADPYDALILVATDVSWQTGACAEILRQLRKKGSLLPAVAISDGTYDDLAYLLAAGAQYAIFSGSVLAPRAEYLHAVLDSVTRPLGSYDQCVRVDGLELNMNSFTLGRAGEFDGLLLTKSEAHLLYHLMARPGNVTTRINFMSILNKDMDIDERTIDNHLKRVRKKITAAFNLGSDDIVEAIYGAGYRLSRSVVARHFPVAEARQRPELRIVVAQ